MRRREFIAFLGTSALPWTLPANAQSGRKIARIGVLWHAGSSEEEREYLTVLVKAFGDLGYIEGKNVEFLNKFPAEQLDRYPVLARELVDSNVDVAIAVALPGAVALKQITSTIPVVFVIVPDPIGLGLVAGLAHPGSNLTGLSLLSIDLSGKSLALLKEATPNLSSVTLFLDPQVPRRVIPAYAAAAKSLGLSFRSLEISAPDTIEPAFAQAQSDRVDGIVVAGSMLFNERARVGASALAHGMPAIGKCFGNGSIWTFDVLRTGLSRLFPQGRRLRRQDTARRKARRLTGRAADPFQAEDQPQDGQGAWVDHSAISAGHSRRVGRMKRPCRFLAHRVISLLRSNGFA
jgi:putative ABC transport system substrate-binding protein